MSYGLGNLMTDTDSVVYIIDDDPGVCAALSRLFRSVGLRAEVFTSANDFMRKKLHPVASCIVLDVRLPGLGGFEFHAELRKARIYIPIVFVTGHGDVPMSVRAMKAGAVDFLTKPFRDQEMLDAVTAAIATDRTRLDVQSAREGIQTLFDSLTPREREVMGMVAAGFMNKQIAAQLSLSEQTVKIHRGNMIRKMNAKSLADLIRMAEAVGFSSQKPAEP